MVGCLGWEGQGIVLSLLDEVRRAVKSTAKLVERPVPSRVIVEYSWEVARRLRGYGYGYGACSLKGHSDGQM